MTAQPDIALQLKSLRRKRRVAAWAFPGLLLMLALQDTLFPIPEWLALPVIFLLVGDLVFVLILNSKIRRAEKLVKKPENSPVPVPKLLTTVILATSWFALDGFVFQQGIISAILILLCVLWMAPSAFLARKDQLLLRFRSRRAAAYFLAALAALGVIRANGYLAQRRAEIVVAAVRKYREKHGQYPQQLQEVTPEFLPSIPLARYSFMWNEFVYFKTGETPRFYYVAYPPFLRNFYNFESSTWGQMD